MDQNFADLLKETRERRGLTQKELATLINADDTYISKIERGVLPPPARKKVLTILDMFQITNWTDRFYFLLAAGCASIEDLAGQSWTSVESLLSSGKARRRRNAFAGPSIELKESVTPEPITLGQKIDAVLAVEGLTEDEKVHIGQVLVPHTRKLAQLIRLRRGVIQNEEEA